MFKDIWKLLALIFGSMMVVLLGILIISEFEVNIINGTSQTLFERHAGFWSFILSVVSIAIAVITAWFLWKSSEQTQEQLSQQKKEYEKSYEPYLYPLPIPQYDFSFVDNHLFFETIPMFEFLNYGETAINSITHFNAINYEMYPEWSKKVFDERNHLKVKKETLNLYVESNEHFSLFKRNHSYEPITHALSNGLKTKVFIPPEYFSFYLFRSIELTKEAKETNTDFIELVKNNINDFQMEVELSFESRIGTKYNKSYCFQIFPIYTAKNDKGYWQGKFVIELLKVSEDK